MTLESVLDTLSLEKEARERYGTAYADSQYRASRYNRYHKYYAPPGGDQWPEDLGERPGKLHFTLNMIRRFVDTEARLLSIRPRITIPPDSQDPETRRRAEATEKLFARYLDNSGFDQWSFVFNQTKSLYGLGVLKPYWNTVTKQPDVEVVEQPQNVMFGWGDSDFSQLDWVIYHYRISKFRAMQEYGLSDEDISTDWEPENMGGGDHEDPVETMSLSARQGRSVTNYERSHVMVWDYWFVGADGIVYNAIMVGGKLAMGPIPHAEMPVIPYIPVESEHEPGSPDGHGIAELLLDLQMGLNRAVSHYAQHVWDTTDPAYQLTGPEAPMQAPPGLVPRPGELSTPGPGNRIDEIRSGVNNFPFDSLIGRYWEQAHRITGLSEILFGVPPGAQTSARALQAQLDSSINSLDPKRQRYYEGLRGLLQFWHYMSSQMKEKVDDIPVKEVIAGLNNWKIIAPEVTPRDVVEHAQNVINKLNAKTISLETAMDELGVDNPLEEIDKIMAERSNAHLFPGDAQAIAAVAATLQAIAAQQGQQQAQGDAAAGQQSMMEDQAAAQPGGFEDQNGPGGAAGIGGELRPIVRESGGGGPGAMSELRLPTQQF